MATQIKLLDAPQRPADVKSSARIVNDPTKEYIAVDGYTLSQQKILSATIDDVELEVDLKTYDRMENDATIAKAKMILITNVLSDDLQMAPGATEDEVTPDEYQVYEEVMMFCQRVIGGLDRPMRLTLEQILGNAFKHGHGISEIEWEYRMDGFSKRPAQSKTPQKSKFRAMMERWGFFAKTPTNDNAGIKRPSLRSEKTRLMPKSIKVKPRGAALFVVDDYMTTLGLVPRIKGNRTQIQYNEIIDRRKFMVLTMKEQNNDPRGRSTLRSAFNWYNLKSQVPAEMLRFILEEAVPKAVGTLSENAPAFEFERDENDNQVYETDPITGLPNYQAPKMKTAAESMGEQIKGFRSGSGAVIPYGAKLEPFKKTGGSSDADFFGKVLKVIDNQMENAILLQTLAQSEGEHQARSASQQVAELLYNLVFWIRWLLSVMISTDVLEQSVRVNLGEWAVRYMPLVSLGDFVRRDWAHDLEVISKAYFQGFIDDTQRAELMAWMNLPRPGPSRQELMQDALAEADVNGEPVKPNKSRPDKTQSNKNRNTGNGTEKNNGNKRTQSDSRTGLGPLNALGHHGKRIAGYARHLSASRRER